MLGENLAAVVIDLDLPAHRQPRRFRREVEAADPGEEGAKGHSTPKNRAM
jgi:hypothetical protein